MRNLIIERIKVLQSEKKESNRIPADPNELALLKDIQSLLYTELDTLIAEGKITVVGKTINKHRILQVKNHENENITD